MSNFKTQDRVKIVKNRYLSAPELVGMIGKVVATSKNNVTVKFDQKSGWWIFFESDLEPLPRYTLNIDRELERVFEANRWGA